MKDDAGVAIFDAVLKSVRAMWSEMGSDGGTLNRCGSGLMNQPNAIGGTGRISRADDVDVKAATEAFAFAKASADEMADGRG